MHYLINIVDVKKLISLPEDRASKEMTCALQLEKECEIDDELKNVISRNELPTTEWKSLDAFLLGTIGNIFSNISVNRYGGE